MQLHRLISPLPLALFLAACNGSDTTVTTQADTLTSAQCTYEGFNAAAQACFETFNTCKSASGAVLADCKSALDACLPPPPPGSHPGHGPGEGGGCPGMGERPPNPDGGLPPPPPPPGGPGGGLLPPPPPPGGGMEGPGGHRRPPPLPVDSAVLTACRDAFAACIAADATLVDACHRGEHDCVRDAFRAAFQARCEEATIACAAPGADAEACARITARCTEGVDGRPPSPDGGACQ